MSISFEQIPADNYVPIFSTEFGGSMSAKSGVMPWKNLIIGQPLRSKMSENGSLTLITSDEQADALFGSGSQLALMIKAFRKNTKSNELWALPVADDATADAAAGTLTFTVAGSTTRAKYFFALSEYTAAADKTVTLTIGSAEYVAEIGTSDTTIANVLDKIVSAASADTKFAVKADAVGGKLVLEAKDVGEDSTTITLATTATLTIGTKVSDILLAAGGAVRLMISGQSCPVNVSAGDSAADIAAKATAAINAKTNLPVTASASSNVVTLTAKNNGACGNGIDIRWNHNQGEVLPDGLSIALVAMANGGADPLFEDAHVKETCAGNWFNMIVIGSADNDNINYIKEMLDERWTAIVQQTGVMCFSLNGGAETDYTDKANALNSQEIVLAALPKSPTSGAEKASALFGCVAPKALNDPAKPLHNYSVAGVVAPRRDDREDFYGNNRLLKAGCAVMTAAEDGSVFTSRIVTTYKRNAQGVQDKSYMQLETVLTLSYLRWDWNNALALKYPHAKLAPDGSKFGKGQQVMTPSLGKAELIARYKIWEEKGLVYDSKGFAQNVVVELDPDDEYAMHFLIPAHLIKQFFVSKSKLVFD